MKRNFEKRLERIQPKLFPIGLAFLFCSVLLGIITRIYGNFIFKFQYYRSLTPPEQQEWWHKLINLEQAAEFLRTPVALILLISTIGTALIGLSLMNISMRIRGKAAEREINRMIEQFDKENPPKKRRKA